MVSAEGLPGLAAIMVPMTKDDKSRPQKHCSLLNIYLPWIVLLLIIVAAAAIRIHLLDVPMERDEGEYAYAGQLMLQGVPPYDQAYNMKLPGIYAAYAAIMAVFGQTLTGVHLGLLVINAATVLFLFLLTRKLFTPLAGLASAASYALMSLGQPVQGIFANAEHFVMFFAISGLCLLVSAVGSAGWSALIAGAILLGAGFLTKQHGAVFIVFGFLYLIIRDFRSGQFQWSRIIARGAVFLIGTSFPFGITCLILWNAGVFDKFWFWTFDYASEYVSAVPLSTGLSILKSNIIRIARPAFFIWLSALIGLTALLWNRKALSNSLFAAGFFLFSFLALSAGFYYRPHYFILFLPSVALLSGIGISSIYDLLNRDKFNPAIKSVPVILLLSMLLFTAWQQRDFLFLMGPTMASRSTYGANPFPESLEIARYIKEHSGPDELIAVIGSEPQIYFYANRRSATGYIYTYALMENHPYALEMQQEMIREIESGKPRFIVFVNINTSWLVRPGSHTAIFDWFQKYSQEHYELVGMIDILGRDFTVYRWDQDAPGYFPRSKSWLSVLRRRT